MADKNANLKLGFDVDKAKIAAARKDIASLAAETRRLDVTTSGLSNTYGKFNQATIAQRSEFLKGTQAIKAQLSVLDAYRQKLQAAQAAGAGGGSTGGITAGRLGSTASAVGSALSGLGVSGGGQIASAGGQLSQVVQQFQNLQTAAGGATASLGTTVAAAGIAGVAIGAIGIAVGEFTKVLDENKKRLENAISGQKTFYELIATGTTEEIKLGLQDLQVKRDRAAFVRRDIQAGIDKLQEQGLGGVDKFTEEVGSRLNQAFGGTGKKEGGIISSMAGFTDQAKAADNEISELDSQIAAYTKALRSNAVAANDAKAALEKQTEATRKQTEDQKQAIRTASDAIKQTQQQAAKDEAAILERAADQRISIAQRAAAAEQDAYTSLQRSFAEDRIKLGQQQADDQLNFQREESQAAKSHLANLLKIRKDAENNEFELILNRDFAGLAASRRQTDQRLEEEDDRARQEREQRFTQFRQRQRDENVDFIRQREARLRAYNQQLSDIRTSKERELKLNNDAATLDLQRLRAKLTAELAMRQDAYSVALQLEANYLARLKALVGGQTLPAPSAINVTQPHEQRHPGTGGFAAGGYPPVGKWSSVNERRGQRESFTSAGQTFMLPGGTGIFKPLRTGRIDPGNNGGGISIGDIHAYGSNPREAAKVAGKIVEQKIAEAFEALSA